MIPNPPDLQGATVPSPSCRSMTVDACDPPLCNLPTCGTSRPVTGLARAINGDVVVTG